MSLPDFQKVFERRRCLAVDAQDDVAETNASRGSAAVSVDFPNRNSAKYLGESIQLRKQSRWGFLRYSFTGHELAESTNRAERESRENKALFALGSPLD